MSPTIKGTKVVANFGLKHRLLGCMLSFPLLRATAGLEIKAEASRALRLLRRMLPLPLLRGCLVRYCAANL